MECRCKTEEIEGSGRRMEDTVPLVVHVLDEFVLGDGPVAVRIHILEGFLDYDGIHMLEAVWLHKCTEFFQTQQPVLVLIGHLPPTLISLYLLLVHLC